MADPDEQPERGGQAERGGGQPERGGQGERGGQEVIRLRYRLYVEALRARLPSAQFGLLMEIIRLWVTHGGGAAELTMDDEEKELFTPEVQQELLHLMGLLSGGSGPEGRAGHVVVQLGDGEHAKGAMSLVPPEVAADAERLRALRDRIDAQERRRGEDRREVEGIARASGMLPSGPGDDT
ncbi:hypothetical protein [Streptomyces clavuligerus]|uniref:hypothetical protein n=1 Tax=Streptomyces clavuligerus TaxID=1901 RepID=UPI00018522B9|nr:hypothetical protein [Streptomyces clavuligerus]AXU17061.1 hypothetical protein D1794_30985 [Streptomyces clavuligerus]MBY6307295.1 hypothetical protein [Streptomyces clavuligerus]QCS10132.1 hypothetical protein CRV15_31680 [Streptomyces clavuligerus]QPJ97819.1 hypothetical protein GE265_32770 [Streptomyces clavuligerus]QPL67332.1 hypothetical protein I3J04_30795 [Streptomyces clavuligerus]